MESRAPIPLLRWPDVVEIIRLGQLQLLGRSDVQQEEYDRFRSQTKQNWLTMSDFILVNKFGLNFLSDEVTGKRIADRTELCSYGDRISVRPNDYPYNFEPGIKHFIVWKIGSQLTDDEIDIATKDISESLANVVDSAMYVNPPHLKSIPDVDHAHVLFYCKDK